MKSVSDLDFNDRVLASERPVMVDFWAEWCGPCKAMTPVLEGLAEKFEGVVDFAKLNVDENPQVREQYGVRGIPTMILIRNGVIVARLTGARPAAQIKSFLNTHLELASDEPPRTATPRNAFDSNPDRKTACVAQLHAHIAAQTVWATGLTFWDGKEGSPMGCATGKSEPVECANELGLPPPLIGAVDLLSTYYGTSIAGAAFAVRWLETVRAGADYSALAQAFLVAIVDSPWLREIVDVEQDLKPIYEGLLGLHRATLAGQPAAEREWSALRSKLAESDDTGSGRAGIIKMLSVVAWPLATDESMLQGAILQLGLLVSTRAKVAMHWGAEDDNKVEKTIGEICERAAQNGIAQKDARVMDTFREQEPALAARYEAQSEEASLMARRFGQATGRTLIELTAA